MAKQITDYLLYRWRYLLGYTTVGLAVVGLLFMAGVFIPGGLSHAEMQSVVASETFSLKSVHPSNIIDAPYKLLQHASIYVFGLSDLSIKLPSLLLAALSIFGMLLLLRMWFRRNVAVITTILVITTGQFLFLAQNGTSDIAYIFSSIWLLVAATMVSRQAKGLTLWKITLFGIGAISLYTPLSLYIILALLSAIVLHPHLRYLARRLSKLKLLLASVCALIIISPLVYAIFKQPSVGLTLLGIPHALPNLRANGIGLLKQYFDFVSPSGGVLMTPVYGLGSMIFILLGIMRLFTTKYTARSYLITAWSILLLPVLLISPSSISTPFVPILLLMAMGIDALLRNWYQLFPRNPYARIAGLLPLAILIGGMITSGFDRYTYGYLYDPSVANNFSQDLTLVNTALKANNGDKTIIVTAPSEQAFYTIVAHHYKNVTELTSLPATLPATMIVSNAAYKIDTPTLTPYRIITNAKSADADRFYIYKSNAN